MISKTMRSILHALSYGNIDVESSRRIADLKKLDAMRIFIRKLDTKICNGDYEVPVRMYFPSEEAMEQEKEGKLSLPVLLFFHGGGWVLESVDTYNAVCRNLARRTGCRVASVEYGLAPEHVFPEGLEDCYAAAREVYRHPEQFGVRSQEITLVGDSAGGNLAAAVSLMARDRGEFEVAQQILIYPATYHDHLPDSRFDSVRENGADYLLTAKRVCDYMMLYAGGDPKHMRNPYFAPLLAPDLSRQPRTLVITAEFDPLRDEGEAYARALRDAGNSVEQYRMPDALHGYFSLPVRFPMVRRTYDLIEQFLNGESIACQTINATEKI